MVGSRRAVRGEIYTQNEEPDSGSAESTNALLSYSKLHDYHI